MTRDEAKNMFRGDKDSYGKPRAVMNKIDMIYDEFEPELQLSFKEAPFIVYNKLCGKLVEIAKANPNKIPKDIPEAMKILNTIKVMKDLYPELKTY